MSNKTLKLRPLHKHIAQALIATSACASAAHAGEDYTVIGGSFFMPTVSPAGITQINPDTAIGTAFSDVTPAFAGDFNCTSTTFPSPSAPANVTCAGTTPHTTATNNGLDSFDFFGQPVFSYFATTGIDAPGTPHPAPTIDLSGATTEFSSFYANWNGTEFNQGTGPSKGNGTVNVTNNFNGTYTLDWESLIVGGAFDGKTGQWTMTLECLTCPAVDPGPSSELSIVQSATTTRTVITGNGNFVVSNDLATPGNYVFDWSGSDPAIVAAATLGTTSSSLTVDPSGLAVDRTYEIKMLATNTVITPVQAANSSIIVKVLSAGNLANVGDTDNDGVQNLDDAIDNTATPTMQQTIAGNGTSFVMESSTGKLITGDTANCANASTVIITQADIASSGGTACSATNNSVDNTLLVKTGIGGYYDFEVINVSQGGSADIIIPVIEPLPINASYRKYTVTNGWQAFVTDSTNTIMSAAGSPGNCAGISDWSNGLTAGHNCMKLTISDGGPNDADGLPNGVVTDPGAVSSNPGLSADDSANQVGAISIFGILLSLPLFLRSYFSRKRQ